jgi:hypothetical protein
VWLGLKGCTFQGNGICGMQVEGVGTVVKCTFADHKGCAIAAHIEADLSETDTTFVNNAQTIYHP